MPIHDWSRVPGCVFRSFQMSWVVRLAEVLNNGLLPSDYYALSETAEGVVDPSLYFVPIDPPEPPALFRATDPPKTKFEFWSGQDHTTQRQRVAIWSINRNQKVALLEVVVPGNKANRHALRDFVENAVGAIVAGIGLLIVDLWPPTTRDPQGIHWAIWQELDAPDAPPPDKPLTLVAYVRDLEKTAYVEPTAIGDALAEMPLFLDSQSYVNVPLESTYQETYRHVPARWRTVIESPGEP